MTTPELDVIVIGAGMAGVTAARELARAQHSVVVLEARDRIGGRIWSVRDFCDKPVEAGAEFVHGREAATWKEIRKARLSTRHSPMLLRSAFHLGDGTRWLPRTLINPETWSCAGMRRGIAQMSPPDLSVLDYIEKKGYRGKARMLTEMTFLQHLPGNAEEVGVLGFVEDGVLDLHMRTNYRIIDGYDTLPRTMANGLDIRLNSPVDTVFWDSSSVRVRLCDGQELEAKTAISTLPVGVLQSDTVHFVPSLPASKQWALEQLYMGPIVKLLLHFRERFWPAWMEKVECGAGPVNLYWCVFRGITGGPPVLTAYAIGDRGARLSKLGEDEATGVIIADLERLYPGTDPRGALLDCRRIDWTQDSYSQGGYSIIRPGGQGARASLRAADTGALFWAGAGTESQPIAELVEAAYVSGLRASKEARDVLVSGSKQAAAITPSEHIPGQARQ